MAPAPFGNPITGTSGQRACSTAAIRAVGAITHRSNSSGARLPALEMKVMGADFRQPEVLLEQLFLLRHELLISRTQAAQAPQSTQEGLRVLALQVDGGNPWRQLTGDQGVDGNMLGARRNDSRHEGTPQRKSGTVPAPMGHPGQPVVCRQRGKVQVQGGKGSRCTGIDPDDEITGFC